MWNVNKIQVFYEICELIIKYLVCEMVVLGEDMKITLIIIWLNDDTNKKTFVSST